MNKQTAKMDGKKHRIKTHLLLRIKLLPLDSWIFLR